MVITFKNVSFRYTDQLLLNKVNFSITDSDKTGLVGLNGTGKSTILKLIMGEEVPRDGQIIKSGNMLINYLPQEPYIKKDINVIEKAKKTKILERHLEVSVPDSVYEELENYVK